MSPNEQRPVHAAYSRGAELAPTSQDISGPFFVPGSPERTRVCDYPTFLLSGRVLSSTDGRPVPGATLDFWQADERGHYSDGQADRGFDLRGRQESSDPDGSYRLETVRPGRYAISETEERCRHLHVKVTAPGFAPLTTQLYFPDPEEAGANAKDRWFDPRRTVRYEEGVVPRNRATFDFVLAPLPEEEEPKT